MLSQAQANKSKDKANHKLMAMPNRLRKELFNTATMVTAGICLLVT